MRNQSGRLVAAALAVGIAGCNAIFGVNTLSGYGAPEGDDGGTGRGDASADSYVGEPPAPDAAHEVGAAVETDGALPRDARDGSDDSKEVDAADGKDGGPLIDTDGQSGADTSVGVDVLQDADVPDSMLVDSRDAGASADVTAAQCSGTGMLCNGNTPTTCIDGRWDNPQAPCALGCRGAGVCDACVSDPAAECFYGGLRTCVSGQWRTTACNGTTPFCYAGSCSTVPPSCQGGGTGADSTCGSSGDINCCESRLVQGGTYQMGRATSGPENDVCAETWAAPCAGEQPEHRATVANFRLDTLEVTVGRFRKFMANYSKPADGAGAHPLIRESGWHAAWNESPNIADSAAILANFRKYATSCTWKDNSTINDDKPINCVDWYTAFAFCAWDGGRLPTEAEWEYAATGGSENRVLPWGNSPPPDSAHATYCLTSGACPVSTLAPVGSLPAGAGRYLQLDLAGNAMEWVLDNYLAYTSAECSNCAVVTPDNHDRVMIRGGSYYLKPSLLRATSRLYVGATSISADYGVRCARSAP